MSLQKILLVDDEEAFVETLALRLSLRGIDAKVALSGKEAICLIHEGYVPDVMFLDLMMPEIDGMEVLEQISKTHPDIRVIILTGHGSKEDELKCRKLGAFDFYLKPVSLDKMIEGIKNALDDKNNNK